MRWVGEETLCDVSTATLADIVATNFADQELTGTITFPKDVSIKNLKTNALGSTFATAIDPAKVLINNIDQTFSESVEFPDNIRVIGNTQVGSINDIDLDTDVARTDVDNASHIPGNT